MTFSPINGDHAIQTVTFQVSLSSPASQADLNAVRAKHKNWRAELPAVGQPQWAEINAGDGQTPPRLISSQGLEFSFLRPDGSPAWAVRLLGSDLVVECNRYTRWARTWGRALKYTLQILEILAKPDPEKKIVSCSLVILDRFRSEDLTESPAELLRRSPFLSEQTFMSGGAWHQYSGWFEPAPGGRVLNQLNLDSKGELLTPLDSDPIENLFVSIQHHQLWQVAIPIPLRGEVESQMISVDTAMNFMHEGNKTVFAQLLQVEMLNRIGFHNQGIG